MESAPPRDAPRPSYTLPVTAFWLSLLSCFMLPLPVAIVLSVVSLYSTLTNPRLPNRGYAIAAVLLSAFWTFFLFAKFIPNYINFGARARKAECNTALDSLYTAQKAFYAQHQRYTERIAELGVELKPLNRYAYFVSLRGPFEERPPGQTKRPAEATGILADANRTGIDTRRDASSYVRAIPAVLAGNVQVGLSGTCPACDITLVCVGDIDGDAGLDVLSVSTKERQGPDGSIPAGETYNDVDDLASRD